MAKSRVAVAKEEQGYIGKPLKKRCRVCKKISVRKDGVKWGYQKEYLSCSVGGFRVTANAVCNLFELDE